MELGEADDDADAAPFRLPLPPEDRLWRHPSELGGVAAPPRARTPWGLAAVSALTGAVLAVSLLAAAGVLGDDGPRDVLVREAADTSPPGFSDEDDAMRIAAATTPAVVQVGHGAGVVFRDDGHVLTTAGALTSDQLVAKLSDGRSMPAHLVGSDTGTDLAVLKIDGDGPFRTVLLGTAATVTVGDAAFVVGGRVTSGRIRKVAGTDDTIETDVLGLGGSAVVGADGMVLGIVSSGRRVVPVDVARAVADDLVHLGRVRLVWLGVRGETVTDGVKLVEILGASPAQAAGLRAGDVVRRVDGHVVGSMTEVRLALRRHHPGDRVVVAFDRAGARRRAVLTLAERPPT